jgi:hypothetical protein
MRQTGRKRWVEVLLSALSVSGHRMIVEYFTRALTDNRNILTETRMKYLLDLTPDIQTHIAAVCIVADVVISYSVSTCSVNYGAHPKCSKNPQFILTVGHPASGRHPLHS